MDHTRKALLIGVGTTPEAGGHFASLEKPVAADLRALASSLRASEYEVEVLQEATRRDITSRISAAAQEVPEGGTLLVHFTGHGVRIADVDYLVPHDAAAPVGSGGRADEDSGGDGWSRPHVVESLVPADISRYLDGCRAATVLWTVDACRSPMSGDAAAWLGSRIVAGPPAGRFALMTGCAAGQVSGHTEEGSFFSLGLAEALRPLTSARTVAEVFAAAAAWTAKAARSHGLVQQPTVRYGNDLAPETAATVICSGRHLLESWRAAARDCPLWDLVPAAQSTDRDRFRAVVEQLLDDSARTVDQAQRRLPDPWADDDFPVRLLGRVLPLLLPEGAALSAVEAAVLVAAPFLHEAAWANRLSAARESRPLRVSVQEEGDARRRHYEQVAESHRHIARKVTDSLVRGSDADARNVSLWLVHRWITEQFETDEHAIAPGFVEPFAAALLGDPQTGGARVGELADAVQEIASAVLLGPPLEETGRREVRVRLGPGPGSQSVRVRPLAVLLHLAAVLSLDVRALPDVVAEHLAVPDGVLPQDVVAALHDAGWYREDEALHLDAVCPHPAIHAALAGAVERADELACAVAEAAQRLPAADAELLAGVPARVTDRRLRPLESRLGRRAYDVPLLRFQLAQTEVRELLMGERLYDGRPELALRELYQNAMDACRYRAMRWRYLRGRGQEPRAWEGRISFVQGEDERGRYVECRDTGVGMGVEQLKSTFTKAGRRFEQSRAFRREQEAWLRHDRSLRLYPNSRFGIGVFSYFMLADEMTIVTRPVGPDGTVAPKALLVHISSSGSLFRIQEYDEPGEDALPDGGTRVRLHLRDSVAGLSCVSVLKSWVLISEFALTAEDIPGLSHTWKPGKLTGVAGGKSAVEAVTGTLWWVEGKGAVVCDGVRTGTEPFGYVLNLTGAHAGKLSVSRTKLQSYDHGWEAQTWQQGAPALESWQGLAMDWLWRIEKESLECAELLWRFLRGRKLQLPVRPDSERSELVSLDQVGYFTLDSSVGERPVSHDRGGLVGPWRAAALGHRGRGMWARKAPPASIAGHPVPAPGWSVLPSAEVGDWRVLLNTAFEQGKPVSEIIRVVRALRITSPAFAAPPDSALTDPDWVPDLRDRSITQGLAGMGARSHGSSHDVQWYPHAPDDLRGLARVSANTRVALGELVERCRRYAGILPVPLPAVPAHHGEHTCTAMELVTLYTPDFQGSWRPLTWPWEVARVAERMKVDLHEVADTLTRFAWLGWPAYSADTVSRWLGLPHELRSFLIRFTHHDAEGRLALAWAATLCFAQEHGVPLGEAEDYLAAATELVGLTFERRHALDSGADGLVPDQVTGSFAAIAHAEGLRLEDGISLRDLASARPDETSGIELAQVMDELRTAGVKVSEGDELVGAWDTMRRGDKQVFTGRDLSWPGADYPVLPTADVLFAAAVEMEESLGTTWKTARRLAASLGLRVPPLPKPLAEAAPGPDERRALIDPGFADDSDGEWQEPPCWMPLTAVGLIEYARERYLPPAEAYLRLSPFRALGALVPVLDAAALDALPDSVPYVQDAVALGEDHRVSDPSGPRVPLDVVSAAGRLGEPVSTTWRRIAPYVPLDPGPAAVIDSVPDVLPLWQDLIVLSVHCDGLLPALHGTVGAEQLAVAARAVGEDAAWVRERLALYAEMFGLKLPDPTQEAASDD
ncbi:caspase family protein [Streptomyces sp. NPDC032472]|uniref:HD domain-containing protein n=1 Tax=Streptomyces sp. NPDC032472 TaxID=3155018 RepID=UPI0034004209